VAHDDIIPIDARLDSPGREGLTGTAPANVYLPLRDPEQVTRPPDGRPIEVQPAWRTDFPIDWPQDAYIERRDFMKFMVLTSAALVVGQFWIAGQNWWRRRRGELEMVRISARWDRDWRSPNVRLPDGARSLHPRAPGGPRAVRV
jgi:hypothetical protein